MWIAVTGRNKIGVSIENVEQGEEKVQNKSDVRSHPRTTSLASLAHLVDAIAQG